MRRNASQKIGGHGNQSATATDGVDKAAKKDQRTNNQQSIEIHFDTERNV